MAEKFWNYSLLCNFKFWNNFFVKLRPIFDKVVLIEFTKYSNSFEYVDFCTKILFFWTHHHRKSTTEQTLPRSYKPFVFVHINEYIPFNWWSSKKTIKDLCLISFSKYMQCAEINFEVSYYFYFHRNFFWKIWPILDA